MGADVTTTHKKRVLSLAAVRYEHEAATYPRHALPGLSTALAGFSAAFHGRQQELWIAEAGLTCTCVDTDRERLGEMSGLYPADWEFVCADIYDYASRRYAEGQKYDLVSLDPPTGQFDRVADLVELWCALARRLVVLGTGRHTPVSPPPGWRFTGLTHRSTFRGGVFWLTIEPE
jgi:hypothetical protein